MVYINGKKIKIYDLDTIDSIIIRIASQLKTIPKYLYFPKGIPSINEFNTDNDIQVEDLLLYIKENSNDDFNKLFEKIKPKIYDNSINEYDDIFKLFIAFNKLLEQTKDKSMLSSFILFLKSTINDKYIPNINRIDIYQLWEERKEIREYINRQIISNEEENKLIIEKNNILEQKANLSFTEFELETIKFKLFLNIKNISIIEIFNLIQLNPRCPFATFNNFYKINKDNIPCESWDISLENDILVKICQLSSLPINSCYESYSDVIISIDISLDIVTVDMELNTTTKNISQELFIESFLSIFPSIQDLKVINIEENLVKGCFYFPKSKINNYIFSDLIMNDKLFSSMMAIDEHQKATKLKNSIYIHFFNEKIGEISANITGKKAEKGDPILRGKDIIDVFKYNSYYVRVLISNAKNKKSILMFQDIFSKLLSIYYDKYDEIFNYYKNFIPTFGDKIYMKIKVKENDNIKPTLKDIAPEVFLSNYTKKCNNKPTIISDDEVEEELKNGKKVMRYPISNNEGFIPRNYICNHLSSPYPGLRDNPLENNYLVPYLPCCFKRDQSTIEGGIYRHYFNGEDLKSIIKKQQNIILTNKFTPLNWYGFLPENIIKMFNTFDDRKDYSFIRKGVSNPKSSFLECVLEALDKDNILNMNDKDRTIFLEKERNKLSNKPFLCKQEMYDFTTEEIINKIKDPNIYLDPQYFINLLETTYDCNIYIFNRNNMNISADLMLPRFLEGYYKTKKEGKCVLIYQHMGSISDNATEPRCELIMRWKETDENDVEYSLNQNSIVYGSINDIFNKLRLFYKLKTEVKETFFPINNYKIKIIEQGIDSYGKTRMLRIKFNKDIITLLTSPIQPMDYKEVNDWVITKVSENIAIEIIKELGIKITGQDVTEDFAKTYNGILGNVEVSIPIEDSIPSPNLVFSKFGINYPEDNRSNLNNYNKYKKIARYMTSYIFWLYSKYLNEENETISLDSILSFREKYIVIDKNFEYIGNIAKRFDMSNPLFIKNKLIVKSEETLKRLLYALRIFSRQREKLLNYYKLENIENYYLDVTDFDQYHYQVIIQGEESLKNWIKDQTINYNLYDTIQINKLQPYFFRNKLVNNEEIYLAQNSNTLEQSLKIHKIWKKKGYNLGQEECDIEITTKYVLFSYKNLKDIVRYEIGGEHDREDDPNIIGYKIDGKAYYTTLLNLN